MSGSDPLDLIDGLTTTDDVSKSETRAELLKVPRDFSTAADVVNWDLAGRSIIYVAENMRFYRKDTSDTTTPTSTSLVRDINGLAFKADTVNGIIGNSNFSGRNLLINASFTTDRRYNGVNTTIADNTYWADRWRYLGEASADCQAKNAIYAGTGQLAGAITFTGTTDKGGAFQVIEGINCKHLRSQDAVLSARLSVSNVRLGNIKMAIISWASTEDGTTADPIASWGASGTNPTLAAGWSYVTTPANLNVTTAGATYSVTGTVGASITNLAVLIWNDDKTYSANDVMYFSDVQLEAGTLATAIERRSQAVEDHLCSRYFRSLGGVTTARYGAARTTSTANGELIYTLVPRMRAAPTVSANNITNFTVNDASVNAAVSALGTTFTAPDTANINLACATVTAYRAAFIGVANANASLWLSAEI